MKTAGKNAFDKFADRIDRLTSKAFFFAACVILVVIWAPSLFFLPNVDTWQLAINTPTTVVTFLLVALLQNTQSRANAALQHKLNAIAEGMADLLDDSDAGEAHQLREAVGLEEREGTS